MDTTPAACKTSEACPGRRRAKMYPGNIGISTLRTRSAHTLRCGAHAEHTSYPLPSRLLEVSFSLRERTRSANHCGFVFTFGFVLASGLVFIAVIGFRAAPALSVHRTNSKSKRYRIVFRRGTS